jgi:hypothetical protein
MVRIPDRLGAVLEQSHLALIEAIERLSLTTDGLAQTTKSSLEALEAAAFRATERHEQAMMQPSTSSTGVTVLEQGHLALIEAIERLSVTTDGLAQTTKSSLEALEAAFRADERREHMVTQPSAYSTEVAELREALSALTEILQRPQPAPAAASDGERAAASAGNREPDLALELHKLLQEIETP